MSGGGYYLFINFIPFGYNETYFVKEARIEGVLRTGGTTALVRLVVLASRTLIRVRYERTRWLRRLFDKYNDTQITEGGN